MNRAKEHIAALHAGLDRSDQQSRIPFRPDVEGLRALAVGLVIASHAGLPLLQGGFVGVDVFFVLSGYLITNLLTQEISSSGSVNFARFYARRARRLLPAAITMVLLVCGADGKMMVDMRVWEQGARDTFAALANQGVKVRFIRDTPFTNYDVTGCLAQAEWDGHTHCEGASPAEALSPEVYSAEATAAANFDKVKFLDLSDQMCGPDHCYIEVSGQVVYRDGDHMTASFSRSLAAVLFQRLRDSEK